MNKTNNYSTEGDKFLHNKLRWKILWLRNSFLGIKATNWKAQNNELIRS